MESAPPFFIQTWLQQYCRCSFFHSVYCSLSNPFCFRSVSCRRAMIPRKIFTSFAKFQRIVSVNAFQLSLRLQELLQAPLFSWEVFVLHGYNWIHWVAKSCTTTAYRWLLRDSQPSLRTLWSPTIKSPKCSARSTAPPMRLLHGPLVIVVLWQISQFRSFGKWVSTLCLPKSTFLANVGSKDGSWEELACESLCWRTLSSKRFSLNSCSHSSVFGIARVSRVLDRDSHFSFGFEFRVGLVNNSSEISEEHGSPRSCRSTRLQDTAAVIRIYPTPVSPSLSSNTFAWHSWRCHGWWFRRPWGRRGMINFLPWKCHGCWRKQAWGRTRW